MQQNDEYLESRVMTATPYQLHMLVVLGAIKFSKQAEAALEQNDRETAHFSLSHARDYVTELIGGLNEEKAPEMVNNLKQLFLFVFQKLVEADMEQDVQKVKDALKILDSHRETWDQLAEAQQQEQQASILPRPKMLSDLPSSQPLDDQPSQSWMA